MKLKELSGEDSKEVLYQTINELIRKVNLLTPQCKKCGKCDEGELQ